MFVFLCFYFCVYLDLILVRMKRKIPPPPTLSLYAKSMLKAARRRAIVDALHEMRGQEGGGGRGGEQRPVLLRRFLSRNSMQFLSCVSCNFKIARVNQLRVKCDFSAIYHCGLKGYFE